MPLREEPPLGPAQRAQELREELATRRQVTPSDLRSRLMAKMGSGFKGAGGGDASRQQGQSSLAGPPFRGGNAVQGDARSDREAAGPSDEYRERLEKELAALGRPGGATPEEARREIKLREELQAVQQARSGGAAVGSNDNAAAAATTTTQAASSSPDDPWQAHDPCASAAAQATFAGPAQGGGGDAWGSYARQRADHAVNAAKTGSPPGQSPFPVTREDAQELLKELQMYPDQWPADLGPCPTTEDEARVILEWFGWLHGMEEQWAAELQSLQQQQQQQWYPAQQWGPQQQQPPQQQPPPQQTATPGGSGNTFSYADPATDQLRTVWLNHWASQPPPAQQSGM